MTTENSLSQITIDAPIDAVTIYSDRALITRRAKIQLEGGARELLLENLPAGLDTDSIRARGSGEVAVKILGVESHTVFLTEENHQAARETQRELDAVTDEGTALVREDEVLAQRLTTLESLAANTAKRLAKSLAREQTNLQSVGQLLDWVQAQSSAVHRERAALEVKQRENSARQIALQNQLMGFKSGRRKQRQSVSVSVEAASAGQWNLEVSYVVTGASWKPLYDARVKLKPPSVPENELEGEVQLAYLASITQNSGEDWLSAALTLSTARPSLSSVPPKLAPIYVDSAQYFGVARSMKRARAADEGEAESFLTQLSVESDYAAAAPAMAAPIEAETETAQVQTDGATVSFELPRRWNVPSDGQPHRASIALLEFPCRLDYFAVPRRGEWAFLRATIQNKRETLLSGEANVFRDDVFIGKTHIELVAPEEEWTIFLGPDEQVKTKRELTRRDVDKNFIGNVRRQTFGYKIEIENLKSHRVQLEILDQIPVARHEQLKVKLQHAEPVPHNDELGMLQWKFALAPKSQRVLTYETLIESPRDMSVSGITD